MNEAAGRRSDLEPVDETALVRAAQGGDPQAFAVLVRHHQRAVYAVAWGLTRNAADADDLAQEAFVRAWQALGRFRAGEPLRPWLARIVVNQALSLFRRRKRRPESALEPLLESGRQFGGGDDPADLAAGREGMAQLEAAFEELSVEHQAVLVLRAVEELSYGEIADALGIPPGTVMSRLSRARTELRARWRARTRE